MGRKVVFSAMLAAGLVQMAPAIAQQDKQQDVKDAPAEAAPVQAAPVAAAPAVSEPVAAKAEPVVAKAEPAPAAPEPVVAKAAEAKPTAVVAQAKVREPDLADKDLAAAPPEELPPVKIDPNKARHGLANLNRPAPARDAAPEAAKPVLAAAESKPEPVLAQADAEDDPIGRLKNAQRAKKQQQAPKRDVRPDVAVAERIVEQAQAEHGADAAVAQAGRAAAAPRATAVEARSPEPESEPAMAAAEEAAPPVAAPAEEVREAAAAPVEEASEVASAPVEEAREVASAPVEEAGDVASAPVEAARDVASASARLPRPAVAVPDPRPVFAGNGRRARPDLAEERDNGWGSDDRAVDREEASAGDDREARDIYPEREAAPVYAADDGYGRPGDDGRDMRGRGYPERRAQVSWPDRNRYDDRTCDNARAVLLQQRVRREAARGLLDRRAASDIDDEIVQLDDLHRSYCASGMNDWREERLERQFTEIEDRIRFEEERYAGAL